MTWAGQITATRRAKPSHEPWNAHAYQRRASEFLQHQNAAALFLDPGLGKTSITLDAFARLKAAGMASRMLVVAPLRVCQTVWRQEAQKWTEFRDLRFSLLHGSKKADRLRDDADVWLINPEGVAWLCERYQMRALPFDTVVIDELTKFKNHGAERSKLLRPRLKGVTRRWGLTGTPAPNGYMDLFGQMLMLDDGAALGKYVTHFRDKYFQVDYNGFDYDLMPGGAKRIEEAIRPYVLRMSAEDYLELPELVDDVITLEMDAASRKTYDRMKKDMLAELPEGVVTGANVAAVYSKLKQMANGAVYVNEKHDVAVLHTTKLEALDDLIEELSGQQLLIGYEFQHDLVRLQAHFGDRLTHLGAGVGEARTAEVVEAWNAGRTLLLACHPASAAHGLNLQYGGCAHVCWLSPIWDLELYQQFIRRVWRQGTEAPRVVNHLLVVKDTIDELALEALRDKDVTQSRLLRGLNTAIQTHADGESARQDTRTPMTVAKLSRQPAAGTLTQDNTAAEPRRIVPVGWGRKAAIIPDDPRAELTAGTKVDVDAAINDEAAQRERIQAKLRGAIDTATQNVHVPTAAENDVTGMVRTPTPAELARAAFSPAVRQQMAEMETELPPIVDASNHRPESQQIDIEDVAPTGQRPAAEPAGGDSDAKATTKTRRRAAPSAGSVEGVDTFTQQIRLGVLQLAFERTHNSKEAMELANVMVEFLTAA